MSSINYLFLALFICLKTTCIKVTPETCPANVNIISRNQQEVLIFHREKEINLEDDSFLKTKNSLRNRQLYYILAAFIDMEANFLVIFAYKFTSITSVMLLDCFTIPSVMFLSYCFLGATYKRLHIAGVFVCCAGLSLVVISDALASKIMMMKLISILLLGTLCVFVVLSYMPVLMYFKSHWLRFTEERSI